MKELYLTITDMTFLAEGRVLGHGRTVAAAAGPEQPGDLSLALAGGTARMGTFYPAEGETPRGHWQAVLEGQEGYAVTFQGERLLLGRRATAVTPWRRAAAVTPWRRAAAVVPCPAPAGRRAAAVTPCTAPAGPNLGAGRWCVPGV